MTDTTAQSGFPVLGNSATEIIDTALLQDRRVLLYGPPGTGKSVTAAQLGQALDASGRDCWCVSADPGSPAFGMPGAVSLGRWRAGWPWSAAGLSSPPARKPTCLCENYEFSMWVKIHYHLNANFCLYTC